MSFYEDDKRKAARLLFDAITDLEARFTETETGGAPAIALDIGKVSAARHYLAATLGIHVLMEDEPVEQRLALRAAE